MRHQLSRNITIFETENFHLCNKITDPKSSPKKNKIINNKKALHLELFYGSFFSFLFGF